jgi:hypothetical protein
LAQAGTKTLEDWGFPTASVPHLGHAARLFFLGHVEGGFYGLIQFLDFAGIARTH